MTETITAFAAVLRGHAEAFTIEEVTLAELVGDEILVKAKGAGICHTDLAAAAGLTPNPLPAVLGALERAGGPGTMLDPAVAAAKPNRGFPDLRKGEIASLTPLVALILVLGFFPGPVLDVITPSVVSTMNEVGLPDPVGGLVK